MCVCVCVCTKRANAHSQKGSVRRKVKCTIHSLFAHARLFAFSAHQGLEGGLKRARRADAGMDDPCAVCSHGRSKLICATLYPVNACTTSRRYCLCMCLHALHNIRRAKSYIRVHGAHRTCAIMCPSYSRFRRKMPSIIKSNYVNTSLIKNNPINRSLIWNRIEKLAKVMNIN